MPDGFFLLERESRTPWSLLFDEGARNIMHLFRTHAALGVTPKTLSQDHFCRLPPRSRPVLQVLVDGDPETQAAM